MNCDERRAAVARAKEALDDYQARPDGKPSGKLLLMQALARAEAALRECEGQTYDVDLLLLDLTNTVPITGSHARLTVPLQQAALIGTNFHFNPGPGMGGALLMGDSGGATLARSPAPLPGLTQGRSSMTVVVPDPTVLTAAALAGLIPPPSAFTVPPLTLRSGFTVTPTVTSITPTLNSRSITISVSGSLALGPSPLLGGLGTFTHAATYTFVPSKSLSNVTSYVDVSAPTREALSSSRAAFSAHWYCYLPVHSSNLQFELESSRLSRARSTR